MPDGLTLDFVFQGQKTPEEFGEEERVSDQSIGDGSKLTIPFIPKKHNLGNTCSIGFRDRQR